MSSTTARRPIHPHDSAEHRSVRRIHIQNLTNLLHVCLLKRDIPRASRAWAILVRCREVDWRSRWQWGLALLEAVSPPEPVTSADSYAATQPGRGVVDRWLRSLHLSAKEADKPAVLHALVLHYIKSGRYRLALEELEMYLTSYPYLLAGPLHTYAGMLSFFLAQPEAARHPPGHEITSTPPVPAGIPHRSGRRKRAWHSRRRSGSGSTRGGRGARQDTELSVATETTDASAVSERSAAGRGEPNESMLSRSRAHFVKALEQDPSDSVAKEFIAMIDHKDDEGGSDDGLERLDDDDDDGQSDKGEEKEDDQDDEEMDDSGFEDDSDIEGLGGRASAASAETAILERGGSGDDKEDEWSDG